jgi:hypothetical protein
MGSLIGDRFFRHSWISQNPLRPFDLFNCRSSIKTFGFHNSPEDSVSEDSSDIARRTAETGRVGWFCSNVAFRSEWQDNSGQSFNISIAGDQ